MDRKLLGLLLLNSAMILAVGCTRKVDKPSRLNITFPSADQTLNISRNVYALSSKWQLSDPTSTGQINCYAVAVEALDFGGLPNRCANLSDTALINPHFIVGGFPAGSTQSLEVPSGKNRRIHLIGFQTDDISKCVAVDSNAAGLANNHFSSPYILTQTMVDLSPGDVDIYMTVPAALPAAGKFEDCLPFAFSRGSAPLPLSLSGITPTLSVPAGGGSVMIIGTGFTSSTTVSIGGNSCTSVVVSTPNTLTCTVPSHSVGTVSVVVTRGIEVATLANAYTYSNLPTVSIGDVTVSENSGTATLTVTLAPSAAADVTFTYATSNGTANAGSDYTASTGTGTITAGTTTTTINIPIVDDSLNENNETFMVALSGLSTNAVFADSSALVTIVDDDSPPTIEFLASSVTVNEDVATVDVTVHLSAASSFNTLVNFSVTGGTATGSGTDYLLNSGSIMIPAGQTSNYISIAVTDDALVEPQETIEITLTNPTNAVLGTILVHTVFINDNDPPTATLTTTPASLSNLTTLAIDVGGTEVAYYKYGIQSGTNCTGVTYGSFIPEPSNITSDISGLADGPVTVCVLAKSTSNVVQTLPTSFNWTKDTVLPTVSLTSGAATYVTTSPISVTATFSKPVTGLTSGGLNLTNATASVSGSGTTYSILLVPSGQGSFSVNVNAGAAQDTAGNGNSVSSTLSRTYDTVAPSPPGALSDNAVMVPSLAFAPNVTWTAATDTGGSGVSGYDYAIGSTSGGTNVVAWTTLGNVTSFQQNMLSLTPGQTYYFSLRARDNAGNISSAVTTDGWIAQGSLVAAGSAHSCVLSSGQVKCWGRGVWGQLGNGTNIGSLITGYVSSLSNAVAISAGDQTTCAIDANSALKCWGDNGYYQVLDGTPSARNTPSATSLTSGVVQVATGYRNGCVVLTSGAVKCWGENTYNEIGDGTTTTRTVATQVSGLTNGSQVALGQAFGCALTTTGGVQCWGYNYSGQLGDGSTTTRSTPVGVAGLVSGGATYIAAGFGHVCAVTPAGAVKCWGGGGAGQLGSGSYSDSLTPVSTIGIANAQTVTAGFSHSCALLADGTVKCWGDNNFGQLGDGGITSSASPVLVSGLASGVVAISAHMNHTCALLSNNTVKCWGQDNYGQIGDATPTILPVAFQGAGNTNAATAIAAGANGTCYIDSAGGLSCMGDNSLGQLGVGSSGNRFDHPVPVTGLSSGVTSVALGWHSTCAVAGGSVMCWGQNGAGQIGDGTNTNHNNPTGISVGGSAIQVTVGQQHACARLSSSVACWGYNASGQLGNGTTTNSLSPVSVSVITGSTQISAGTNHTCALNAGSVKCWGANTSGQLGNGTTIASSTPVSVSGISTATKIAASGDHTCATLSSGAVMCWGSGSQGELGSGSYAGALSPVAVSGIASNAISVASGEQHSCAALLDGTVKCWGSGIGGRLGDGPNDPETAISNTPVVVLNAGGGNLTGAVDVAVGTYHSCALKGDGTIRCWGTNTYGQLGNGINLGPYLVPGAP